MDSDSIIALDGEWEFYPNKLIMKEAVGKEAAGEAPVSIQVPGNWGKTLSPDTGSNYGYGSYRLRILLDPEDERLFRIRLKGVATSSELYVNGRLLEGSGKPAESKQGFKDGNSLYSVAFNPDNGTIDVVIQAANYSDRSTGGISYSIKFGTEAAVSGEMRFNFAMEFLVTVVLGLHVIYALLIYLFGAREKVLLTFAALVFSAMLMVLTDDDRLLQQWLSLSRDTTIRLQIMSLGGIALFLLKFGRGLLPDYMPHRAYRPMQVLNTAAIAFAVVLPVTILLPAMLINFMMLLMSIVIFLIVTIRLIKSGSKDAVFLMLGTIAIILSGIGGLLKNTGWYVAEFYPIDLTVAFLASSSFWFRRYNSSAALTAHLSEKLQEEVKRKDDFLANVSHELRNPLHGILNITQTVLETEKSVLGERNTRNLELIVTVGRRMSFMLNDLLDLTLLKEKGIRLKEKPVQIQTVAAGVIDMLRFMTEGKQIRFDNQIPKTFPMVIADESRLIQILFNLLHNAVKFTNEGVITVRAQAEGGQAMIHVVDTGVGMDVEQQSKVFEPYEQGETGITAISGGIGLGLSICKQLVELHGGVIQVSSVRGQGSSFTFSLSLAGAAYSAYSAVPENPPMGWLTDVSSDSEAAVSIPPEGLDEAIAKPHAKADGEGPIVLIIDDDSVNRIVMENILAADGCRVITAGSGREALSVLDSREWDMIIADVMMPAMSGYELTRLIRDRFTIAELPVLLLTARSRPEDLQAGFLCGANDYVTKPVDAAELRMRVWALTELKYSVRDRLRLEAAWLQAQIKPHFLFNTLNSIAALGDFDTTRMRSLLEAFGNYLKASFDFRNSERLVPLEQELALVRSYLHIEKERFEDRIQVRFEVDEGLVQGLYIPPLTIQTLVENAVRHGILRRSQGGEIVIRITRCPEGADVAIIDNGVGMDKLTVAKLLEGSPKPGSGIGLRNTDRRLKQIYGKGLHIRSRLEEGTTVAFRLREAIVQSSSDAM
ncbi:hybrid sensor histidine kinase/response regulator [Paenibacillus spongiae]|uniref:histidine kinase n=1 Tax=Paenibacillus spongiae TaxID=2909671 RepID=A0ABY5S446_9BACL|nr:ATP-binding protein [Paenibacillus spongiae]UVI28355.1 ATP-binding protein [Paenibacillus spongiae]